MIRTYVFLVALTHHVVFSVVVPPVANLSVVPPVANLSVVCHNFKNVLFWNYSLPDLRPRFIVRTQDYSDTDSVEVCSDISVHHCDVSSSTKKTTLYKLTVIAVVGESQSEPEDLSISYDHDYKKDVNQSCSVDLPHVNITVQSDQSQIRAEVPHPFHLYRHAIDRSERKRHKMFYYTVVMGNSSSHFSCDYDEQHVCQEYLQVEGGAEKRHCVTIEGQMGNVKVESLQNICTEPQPSPTSLITSYSYITYIAVASLVFIVLCCTVWMVYKKMTSSSSPLPGFMVSKWSDMVRHLRPEETCVSEVHSVTPTGNSPLLKSPVTTGTFLEENDRHPVGRQVLCEERHVDEVMTTPGDGTGFSFEDTTSEEESGGRVYNSGYDRGHVISVREEMRPGDLVEGYKSAKD